MAKANRPTRSDTSLVTTEPSAPQQPDPVEGGLIAASLAGDDQAFARLVARHRGKVAATVIGMLGPGPEADDVGQEVFLQLHRSLAGFRAEASLGTWLTRIAINRSLDELRRRQRRFGRWLRLGSDSSGEDWAELQVDGEAEMERRDRQARVRAAVQRLKPDWRAVVVLRWLQGYSTLQTAELLGIPKGTVLSRLSRALDKLRGELGELQEEEGSP
jgi:RNA polymerase sigma-70 factor, ECF subfamily